MLTKFFMNIFYRSRAMAARNAIYRKAKNLHGGDLNEQDDTLDKLFQAQMLRRQASEVML